MGWPPRRSPRGRIRQAEGDLIEASLLVRSYRSTLPRLGYTVPTPVSELEAVRRIVPAFREPPGRQLLGRTLDYTERLVDFRDEAAARAGLGEPPATPRDDRPAGARPSPGSRDWPSCSPPAASWRTARVEGDPEPVDVTRDPVITPAPRSARLAVLARGETGALVNLWYQGVRGDRKGAEDITLGEVRVGDLPVTVAHPRTGGPVRIGSVQVTEVEAMSNLNRPDEDTGVFDIGYGLVLGHNERKAIAMAVLDIAMHRDRGRTNLEQNVIGTCDGTDASGFLEHLKLPHYVTFGSQVERKEAIRR